MPEDSPTLQTLNTIKAVNEVIEGFKRRLDDTDRSVVVEIDNLTDLSFRKTGDSHQSGGFDTTPEPVVKPKSNSIFTSQNTVPLQGTEGCVAYAAEGIDNMAVCWDHPFIGSIAAAVHLRGPRENRYTLEVTVGSGNVGAHMRYVLFDVAAPYSLKAFLEKFDRTFFMRQPGDFDEIDLERSSGRKVGEFLRKKHPGRLASSLRAAMRV